MFVLDSYAMFAKVLVLFAASVVLILSTEYFRKHEASLGFEVPILVILSVVGMLVMISATDLLSVYIGLEMQSLALYVIAASKRGCNKASEAGIKYFVLGALASGILLYGISFVYGYSGSTNLYAVGQNISNLQVLEPGMVLGLVLILVGLCFKLSAAPFHMWAPDVYEGVPTPVTAFFAIVPKLAAVAVLTRILNITFADFMPAWQQVVVVISVASMLVGAFAGIWQKNIKRLLAYSGIGHMGYALVALAAGGQAGVAATLAFFVIYILASIGLFAVILSTQVDVKGTEDGIEQINHFSGLAKNHPKTALVLTALLLSFIGLPIPPFAGFFGKFFVFEAAIKQGLYVLAVIGMVASVVSCFYYLRIIKIMYFDAPPADANISVKMDSNTITTLVATALLSLAIFIKPSLILTAAKVAAGSLF
jgi:NADH-quinone oxidoreductase subunit N